MSVKPTTSKIPPVKLRGFLKSSLKYRAIVAPSEGFASTGVIRAGSQPIAMEGGQQDPIFRDESDVANFESTLDTAIKNNPFNRDVEKAFDGGIGYGFHNFDPLRDDMVPGYNLGTPLGNTINYKKGPLCDNMDAQFFMIECPPSAANVYSFGTIPHDLERIPVGALIITLTPVVKTTFPFTIAPDGAFTIDFVYGDPVSWNDQVFRVKSNRYSGGSNGSGRAIGVVF